VARREEVRVKVQGSSPRQGEAQGVEKARDGAQRAREKDKADGKESAFERMMRGEEPGEKGEAKGAERKGADLGARAEEPGAGEVDAREEPEALAEEDEALAEEPEDAPDASATLQERGMAGGELRAEAADSAEGAEAPREVDAVVQEMVEACYVGEDAQARKVVMLEIALPGRGMVRARIRRERDGVHVRLRAKDPATKELLRAHKDELMQGAKERGVDLKGVDVV
jgi:hypothetical protein